MRITLAAIGRLKAGPETELVARYVDRLTKAGRAVGITSVDVLEFQESRASTREQRQADEAASLTGKLSDATIVAFDERGKQPDSAAFAEDLRALIDTGTPHIAFVIGGHDGLDDGFRRNAHKIIAFGRLTLPHQLARIMVAEQVYRAVTILTNHPYHREG